MSSRLVIPKSAQVIATFAGEIPEGPRKGERATFILYSGTASKGYKTGYAPVPCRWLEVRTSGNFRQAWAYSGKRYSLAQVHFSDGVMSIKRGA